MKAARCLSILLVVLWAPGAFAQEKTWVGPYTRSDGTAVRGYFRGGAPAASGSSGLSGKVAGPGSTADRAPTQYIGGYIRKDGVVVKPHIRTVADGILENNLSYDADAGISIRESLERAGFAEADIVAIPGLPLDRKISLGYLATFATLVEPASLDEQVARIQLAAEMSAAGTPLDWRRHSLEELVTFQKRARKAEAVRRLGIEVDWRQVTYARLLELECIGIGVRDVKAAGLDLDPTAVTCQQVQVLAHRAAIAARIKAMGREVDWVKMSVDDLVELEEKLDKERN